LGTAKGEQRKETESDLTQKKKRNSHEGRTLHESFSNVGYREEGSNRKRGGLCRSYRKKIRTGISTGQTKRFAATPGLL